MGPQAQDLCILPGQKQQLFGQPLHPCSFRPRNGQQPVPALRVLLGCLQAAANHGERTAQFVARGSHKFILLAQSCLGGFQRNPGQQRSGGSEQNHAAHPKHGILGHRPSDLPVQPGRTAQRKQQPGRLAQIRAYQRQCRAPVGLTLLRFVAEHLALARLQRGALFHCPLCEQIGRSGPLHVRQRHAVIFQIKQASGSLLLFLQPMVGQGALSHLTRHRLSSSQQTLPIGTLKGPNLQSSTGPQRHRQNQS